MGNNRNILECKCDRCFRYFIFKSEIIETYWNVNFVRIANLAGVETEIIETYWNILKCK